MWHSADEEVTKCHVRGEEAKLFRHKRTFSYVTI